MTPARAGMAVWAAPAALVEPAAAAEVRLAAPEAAELAALEKPAS